MKKILSNIIIKFSLSLPYLYDRILAVAYKNAMKYCGENVYIRPSSSDFKGLPNLSVGGVLPFRGDRLFIVPKLLA